MKKKIIAAILTVLMLTAALAACSGNGTSTGSTDAQTSTLNQSTSTTAAAANQSADNTSSDSSGDLSYTGGYSGGVIDTADLFTSRDLKQEADTSGAQTLTVTDGQDITVTEEGVYVVSGTASDMSIIVEAADDAKVQLVLNGVSITNSSAPAIYVKNADKVFVTTASGTDNTLTVSGTFTADGDTNTDAVIYSKDDLVLNGTGTLNITSTDNGISGKDDIKITGGTININCTSDGIEANESIAMSDGSITVSTVKDGFHCENDEDDTTGFIYIGGGSVNIDAGSDGIQATTVLQIDNGAVTANASPRVLKRLMYKSTAAPSTSTPPTTASTHPINLPPTEQQPNSTAAKSISTWVRVTPTLSTRTAISLSTAAPSTSTRSRPSTMTNSASTTAAPSMSTAS